MLTCSFACRCACTAIHDPYAKLGSQEFSALGYPKPIVEHKAARARALSRYKLAGANPGEQDDALDEGDEEEAKAAAKGKKRAATGKKAVAVPRRAKKRAVVVESDGDEGSD